MRSCSVRIGGAVRPVREPQSAEGRNAVPGRGPYAPLRVAGRTRVLSHARAGHHRAQARRREGPPAGQRCERSSTWFRIRSWSSQPTDAPLLQSVSLLLRDDDRRAAGIGDAHPADVPAFYASGRRRGVRGGLERGFAGTAPWRPKSALRATDTAFLVRSIPLRDDEGRILRYHNTASDIDERKKAERRFGRAKSATARSSMCRRK